MNAFGPDNLAVYICSHVSNQERPILLVSHADGDWQFLCGAFHDIDELPKVVGVGHLVGRDSTLIELACLPLGEEAERLSVEHPWVWSSAQPSVPPDAPAAASRRQGRG